MPKKTTEAPQAEAKKEGIVMPTAEEIAKITGKQPVVDHRAEELAKGKWGVVSANGLVVRIYEKVEGCDDPKAAAESYAKKLSQS